MNNSDKEKIEKWIATWEKAGSALDRVRITELRSRDYYRKNQALLNELLQYAYEHRRSGLPVVWLNNNGGL